MRLNEYQIEAKKFSCYPKDKGRGLNYLIHKLNGKVGEISEKMVNFYSTYDTQFRTFSTDILPELGDVLYLIANLAIKFGSWQLEDLVKSPTPTNFLYNVVSILGKLTANCNKVSGFYCKSLGKSKKLLSLLPSIKQCLSTALWAIAVAAGMFGTTIELLAEQNLLKLTLARQKKRNK